MNNNTILKTAVYAMALAAMASCSIKEMDSVRSEKNECYVIANREDFSTKASIQSDGTSIFWDRSDELKVFVGDQSAKFVSTNDEPAASVKFKGSIEYIWGQQEQDPDRQIIVGLSPYSEEAAYSSGAITTMVPTIQNGEAGTFDKQAFISAGASDTWNMGFYNLCCLFKFKVNNSGITRVIIKSNSEELLSGKISIALDDQRHPYIKKVTDGTDRAMLLALQGGFVPGTTYYLTALPCTLSKGFTMYFYSETGAGKRIKTGEMPLARNTVYDLGVADEGVEFSKPEMVDLGLSVKWANVNLGAVEEDDYGDYFAWGETAPKNEYGWKTYTKFIGSTYSDDNKAVFTKYVPEFLAAEYGSNGFFDNKGILESEDDAASVILGDKWRMPTFDELKELCSNCTVEWITLPNGVSGAKYTSKVEGFTDKSIFLPAGGNINTIKHHQIGQQCRYWTSEIIFSAEYFMNARAFHYPDSDDGSGIEGGQKCFGRTIRPVYGEEPSFPDGISLNKSELSVQAGHSGQIKATLTPSSATVKTVCWESSDTTVVKVNTSGRVTGVAIGTAKVTAHTIQGNYSASCDVIVTPEAVDLGLKVKWASCNIGAKAEEEYGDYFAWGETAPKAEYNWKTYTKFTSGTYSDDNQAVFTKYVMKSVAETYGDGGKFFDDKSVLDPLDDAAHVNWGAGWRMPTKEDLQELIENCNAEWVTLPGGISGVKYTSKVEGYTDKSIFLPAGGYASGSLKGSRCTCWMSTLNTSMNRNAYALILNSDLSSEGSNGNRYYGRNIRPVTE